MIGNAFGGALLYYWFCRYQW